MTITDVRPVPTTSLARLQELTGTKSDEAAISEAIRQIEQSQEITPDRLVERGEFLVIPSVGGHVVTDEMVEAALADDY